MFRKLKYRYYQLRNEWRLYKQAKKRREIYQHVIYPILSLEIKEKKTFNECLVAIGEMRDIIPLEYIGYIAVSIHGRCGRGHVPFDHAIYLLKTNTEKLNKKLALK